MLDKLMFSERTLAALCSLWFVGVLHKTVDRHQLVWSFANCKAHVTVLIYLNLNTKCTTWQRRAHVLFFFLFFPFFWQMIQPQLVLLSLDPLKRHCKLVDWQQICKLSSVWTLSAALCLSRVFSCFCLLQSCFHTLSIKNITLFTSEMFCVYIF